MSDQEWTWPQPEIFTAERHSREGWYGLQTPIEPAETFSTSGASDERADAFLRKHGCEIRKGGETTTIIYPAGTIRQILYPTSTDERYRLRLPDGIEMREVHGQMGVNNLLLPREALEREIPRLPSHRDEMP